MQAPKDGKPKCLFSIICPPIKHIWRDFSDDSLHLARTLSYFAPMARFQVKHCCLFFLIFLPFLGRGQTDTVKWFPAPPLYYSFVDYDENVITHVNKLDTAFFKKLAKVRVQHKGRVNIVHIGDSHLQADMLTAVLRNGFQEYFGNLGRGLIFPYQLANTNAPRDFTTSSNTTWKSNRIGVNKPVKTGVCGFGIHSAKDNATIRVHLKDVDERMQCFNRMVFFLGEDSTCYKLSDSNLSETVVLHSRNGSDTPSLVYECDSMLCGFELTKSDTRETGDFSCYGMSLEIKDTCGVLYHTIGVNGARFDQYLQNDLFWRQLKALNGDLFIVSLGTNEAQNPTINESKLLNICDSFVRKIRRASPKAAILFTTPAGSYFKAKKPNPTVQTVSRIITQYCAYHEIPCWDLNKITDGANGAVQFKKYNLLSRDLVHYTQLGYEMQGLLLLNAFADAYNKYYKSHPIINKPAAPSSKPKVVIKYIEKGKDPHN